MRVFKYSFLIIITISCFIGCVKKENNMLVIGHRGAMGYETENTLASIQKALDFKVDAIEIDVFKIKSGEIVVFHDTNVERLTNGSGPIEQMNIVQVKNLKLENDQQIPLLQDVLKLIDTRCKLNIELKGKGTVDKVNYIVNYYINKKGWSKEDFIISSFYWDELEEFRKVDPEIAIAVLTEEDPLEAIETAKQLKATAINPYYKTLKPETVKQIQQNGFKVYPYTVNEVADITKMAEMGVDGIFTNFPDRAQN